MSMTAYILRCSRSRRGTREKTRVCVYEREKAHARRAKGNPVPIPEPGSGTAYNSGPRKSVRRGNPK